MKTINVNITQVNPQPKDQDDRVEVANYVFTIS
jgi:hypothetical protein